VVTEKRTTTERRVSRTGRLYERELPGGGFVAIDVSLEAAGDEAIPRTRVWVERRSEADRRSGHTAPVIAEADGDEASAQFTDMLRIARDNVAIARALLDLRSDAEQHVG
jgi:hypothetical protein